MWPSARPEAKECRAVDRLLLGIGILNYIVRITVRIKVYIRGLTYATQILMDHIASLEIDSTYTPFSQSACFPNKGIFSPNL